MCPESGSLPLLEGSPSRPRGRLGARGWARWRASSGRTSWTSGAGPWGTSALGSGLRLPLGVHLSSPSASCHLFWSPVTVRALLPPPPPAGTHFPTYISAPHLPEDTRQPRSFSDRSAENTWLSPGLPHPRSLGLFPRCQVGLKPERVGDAGTCAQAPLFLWGRTERTPCVLRAAGHPGPDSAA